MSSANLKIFEVRLKSLAVAVGVCLLGNLCLAQSPAPQRSGTTIRWLIGPGSVGIGGGAGNAVAVVKIPAGFGFVGDADARAVLAQMNILPPNDLRGVIAPPEEKWVAMIQYADIGYIRNAAQEAIDSPAILGQIRSKIVRQMKDTPKGVPFAAGDVDWEMPPTYDSEKHKL
jgi:uncharacterized membrane-anchored protein